MIISILSCIVYCIYFLRLIKIDVKFHTIEQHLLGFLGITLMLFNDPFILISIYYKNLVLTFFSILFYVNFLSIIFIYWILKFEVKY
jgi:hypothetical protein